MWYQNNCTLYTTNISTIVLALSMMLLLSTLALIGPLLLALTRPVLRPLYRDRYKVTVGFRSYSRRRVMLLGSYVPKLMRWRPLYLLVRLHGRTTSHHVMMSGNRVRLDWMSLRVSALRRRLHWHVLHRVMWVGLHVWRIAMHVDGGGLYGLYVSLRHRYRQTRWWYIGSRYNTWWRVANQVRHMRSHEWVRRRLI